MKKLIIFSIIALAIIGAGLAIREASTSNAVSGSDWKAGNIVSDLEFTNANSMSASDIQAFLNSQVANCDTNGTQPATEKGRSDITHAQYAASRGWPGPPYVCLKDFYEVPKETPGNFIPANNFSGSIPNGAVSAAQIIYNAARKYNISPKALIVKIATESAGPLTSDNWPMQSQYTYAMGSHCPDSGPGGSPNCDRNYAGFSMQMDSAGALLRYYLDNMQQSWWSYKKPFQTNSILWNIQESNCGASNVFIESRATAALYTYTPYQPNQAALNNLYGTGDGCSAYGNRNFWRVWSDLFGSTQNEPNIIQFKSHIGKVGWTSYLQNRGTTGTVGQSKPLEALSIKGQVEYSSYSYTTGWQPTVNNGMISGTTSINRSIQGVKINLTGSAALQYDIFYRTHIGGIGWKDWTKNGSIAGITGSASNNIEAIDIQVLPKGSNAPGSVASPYTNISTLNYAPALSLNATAHVSDVGWQPTLNNDMTIGNTEQGKRMEALKIQLTNNTGLSGSVIYSAHVSNIGWQPFTNNGQIAGTEGKSLQMEAFRIALTGQLGDNYDIWYRTYVKASGWLGWAKNGTPAGTMGTSQQLEALEIHILPKNTAEFVEAYSIYDPLKISYPDTYEITYDTHQSNIGWVNGTRQNGVAGTTGLSRSIEALRISSSTSILSESVTINCSGYSKGLGWGPQVSALSGECGTTGQTRPLQAIKLTLGGSAAAKYDIYYRVHLSVVGWQFWVKNGAESGFLVNPNLAIEAVSIRLVEK